MTKKQNSSFYYQPHRDISKDGVYLAVKSAIDSTPESLRKKNPRITVLKDTLEQIANGALPKSQANDILRDEFHTTFKGVFPPDVYPPGSKRYDSHE